MSAPTARPNTSPVNALCFVDSLARGYVEPDDPALVEQWRTLIMRGWQQGRSARLWRDLVLIKLLAPEASADLVICPDALVTPVIAQLARHLTLCHYLSEEPR
jgi:hypothetical protein